MDEQSPKKSGGAPVQENPLVDVEQVRQEVYNRAVGICIAGVREHTIADFGRRYIVDSGPVQNLSGVHDDKDAVAKRNIVLLDEALSRLRQKKEARLWDRDNG